MNPIYNNLYLSLLNERLLNLCLSNQERFTNTDSPKNIKETLNQILKEIYQANNTKNESLSQKFTKEMLAHCMEDIDSDAIAQKFFKYIHRDS